MAAITPFLGQQAIIVAADGETQVVPDPSVPPVEDAALSVPADLSEAAGELSAGMAGLGATDWDAARGDAGYYTSESERFLQEMRVGRGLDYDEGALILDTRELSSDAINKSHAELLQTAWVRKFVYDHLRGRSVRVVATPRPSRNGTEVHLLLDGPGVQTGEKAPPVPAWNPPASPKAARFSLLSWTSKMGCPSFSLPAGPAESGGACPGAVGGQSIVPREALLAGARRVAELVGRPVRLQQAVCQYCYAEGGQYATWQVQLAQAVTYAWTRSALEDGTFVDVMVYAIEGADYLLSGGKKAGQQYRAETLPGRYFRWHDSGDIFSAKHLRALVEIARRCPTISFWAPTRIWATGWGVREVNAIALSPQGWPPNFALRPSAFVANDPPPDPAKLGPGWAAGSVVFHEDNVNDPEAREIIQWQCPTYDILGQETASCRNAQRPDDPSKKGCRACWREVDKVVNYTLH